MDIKKIISIVDHTYLAQTATNAEIEQICDDAITYGAASVCIPPCYVSYAKNYTSSKIPICTVIGFPNGYSKTEVKVFETETAIKDGADEIDMVINICMLKNKQFDLIQDEISEIKKVCSGKILKVIIETCLLSEDEKIKMCEIVSNSGADFIKTSTGFSTSGASFDDIKLFSENIKNNIRIKAAGGISSLEDADRFLQLGAARLGTSRIIKIAKGETTKGY